MFAFEEYKDVYRKDPLFNSQMGTLPEVHKPATPYVYMFMLWHVHTHVTPYVYTFTLWHVHMHVTPYV